MSIQICERVPPVVLAETRAAPLDAKLAAGLDAALDVALDGALRVFLLPSI